MCATGFVDTDSPPISGPACAAFGEESGEAAVDMEDSVFADAANSGGENSAGEDVSPMV